MPCYLLNFNLFSIITASEVTKNALKIADLSESNIKNEVNIPGDGILGKN